jgi:hypothetical protein
MFRIDKLSNSIYSWLFGNAESCKQGNERWIKVMSWLLRFFVIGVSIVVAYCISIVVFEISADYIVPIIFGIISLLLSRAGLLVDVVIEATGLDVIVALSIALALFAYMILHIVTKTGWVNKLPYHNGGKTVKRVFITLLVLYVLMLCFGSVEPDEYMVWFLAVFAIVLVVLSIFTQYWRLPVVALVCFIAGPFIVVPLLKGGGIIAKHDSIDYQTTDYKYSYTVRNRPVVSNDYLFSSTNYSSPLSFTYQTRVSFRGFGGVRGPKGRSVPKSSRVKSRTVGKVVQAFSRQNLTKILNFVKLKLPKFVSTTSKPVATANLNAAKPIRQHNKNLFKRGKELANKVFGRSKSNQQVAQTKTGQQVKKTEKSQADASSNAQHKAMGNAKHQKELAKRQAELNKKALARTETIKRPEVKGFANNKRLTEHWNNHKRDYPSLKDKAEYATKVKNFFKSPPEGTMTGVRGENYPKYQVGDIVQWNPKTNNFGIMSKDGTLRTMYKLEPYHPVKNPRGYDASKYSSPNDYFLRSFKG